uniref:Late nodulin domain-containing protein n=1 Tax=Medicago truncatula TaxID=3880 RepID=I3T565_MEDTR|nr:unknown [Medicago truncatula]
MTKILMLFYAMIVFHSIFLVASYTDECFTDADCEYILCLFPIIKRCIHNHCKCVPMGSIEPMSTIPNGVHKFHIINN